MTVIASLRPIVDALGMAFESYQAHQREHPDPSSVGTPFGASAAAAGSAASGPAHAYNRADHPTIALIEDVISVADHGIATLARGVAVLEEALRLFHQGSDASAPGPTPSAGSASGSARPDAPADPGPVAKSDGESKSGESKTKEKDKDKDAKAKADDPAIKAAEAKKIELDVQLAIRKLRFDAAENRRKAEFQMRLDAMVNATQRSQALSDTIRQLTAASSSTSSSSRSSSRR